MILYIMIMAIGLVMSALLHYLYRNTYTRYERVGGVKVWRDKVVLRRKHFLLCYGINVFPIINIVFLIYMLANFIMDQNEYNFHFEVSNTLTRWLDEEV